MKIELTREEGTFLITAVQAAVQMLNLGNVPEEIKHLKPIGESLLSKLTIPMSPINLN